MSRESYVEEVKADVLSWIEDAKKYGYIPEATDRDELEEKLNDELFVCDEITGNGSGSYYFNSYRAEERICHEWELFGEMCGEYGYDGKDIFGLIKQGAETIDVCLRCYVLGEAIYEALDELEEEGKLAELLVPEDEEEEDEEGESLYNTNDSAI